MALKSVLAREVKTGDVMKDHAGKSYWVESVERRGPNVDIQFTDGLLDRYGADSRIQIYRD
ncbi:hypothetical protein P67b_00036 [Ruegeria phage Tedan]|nr:hypothetical protein P67b_00036 [Ruegeria phage Tedan]